MTWVTWRLQRTEYLMLGLMLVVLSGLLLLSHGDAVRFYDAMAASDCLDRVEAGEGKIVVQGLCLDDMPGFGAIYQIVETALPWLNFLPLIAALLLVLPMVNEFESGTYRLAWTQGVSRLHWTRVKIGLLSLCGLVFAAVFSLVFRWWSAPMNRVNGRFEKDSYDLHGTLPVGHTLFAIGLMLAVSVAMRRTVPAIFIASILYLVVRIPFMIWARPYLVDPLKSETSANPTGVRDGSWWLSSYFQDPAGNRVSDQRLFTELCPPSSFGVNGGGLRDCITRNGLVQIETYHPASHYWPLQLIETGIFLAAGIVLIAFAVWYLLRRIE